MKSLDDFSTEEKIEIFNEVYKMCRYHADRVLDKTASCEVDCDCMNYLYEYAMMSCLGKTIFKEINE
jgi:hypothetical protein